MKLNVVQYPVVVYILTGIYEQSSVVANLKMRVVFFVQLNTCRNASPSVFSILVYVTHKSCSLLSVCST